MTCEDPSYCLILGLARIIRYEGSIQFATLEVEDLNSTAAGLLVKVYEKFRQQCTQGVSHPECEFAIHKDVVHVGRFTGWRTVISDPFWIPMMGLGYSKLGSSMAGSLSSGGRSHSLASARTM
jgi:hypothetical protein